MEGGDDFNPEVQNSPKKSSKKKPLKKQMSDLDRTKAEYMVLKMERRITVFKENGGGAHEVNANVEVMKKREGRVRLRVSCEKEGEEEVRMDEERSNVCVMHTTQYHN